MQEDDRTEGGSADRQEGKNDATLKLRKEAFLERNAGPPEDPDQWWLQPPILEHYEELVRILSTRMKADAATASGFARELLILAFEHRLGVSLSSLEIDPRRRQHEETLALLKRVETPLLERGAPPASRDYIDAVAVMWFWVFGRKPGWALKATTPFVECCQIAFEAAHGETRGFRRDTFKGMRTRLDEAGVWSNSWHPRLRPFAGSRRDADVTTRHLTDEAGS